MPLLNEGTTVLRPVVAFDMGNNVYKIIGTEQGLKPEDLDEEWLFPVGSCVTCIVRQDVNGMILIVDKKEIRTKNMSITPIKTENDYRAALKRMELLFDAPIDTPESDEADILGLLIDEYEKNIIP